MKPDFTVYNDNGAPSMQRWHLIRTRWLRLYLHKHVGDDRTVLHDHSWHSLSLCLKGGYWEVLPRGLMHKRNRWALVYRRPETPHRIVLTIGADGQPKPAWTLFLTGPKVREWGFHFRSGWLPWQQAVEPDNPGKMREGIE